MVRIVSVANSSRPSVKPNKQQVLDTFPMIKVAVAYHLIDHTGVRTQTLKSFPADLGLLDGTSSRGKVEIEYKEFEGWQSSIKGISKWDDLPARAKDYVTWIEEFVETPVRYIGTGTGRRDVIIR